MHTFNNTCFGASVKISIGGGGRGQFNKVGNKCTPWCRGVVVKHADSQHKDSQFDSSTCHI